MENAQSALVKYVEGALVQRADSLADILPNDMTPARFTRVVVQAIAGNPSLVECSRSSIVLAVLEAAQLGLEPTGSLSRAWLVPYRNKGGKKEARLQIGWMGLCDLARRSGEVEVVTTRVVYAGDYFKVFYGSDPHIDHEPDFAGTRDPDSITHVYAQAWFKGVPKPLEEVMTKPEVDLVRRRAQAANSGPWVTDYPEMARKTVLRRLMKYLPLTVDARLAIEKEDEVESTPPPADELKARLRARLTAAEAPGDVIEGEVVSESTPDESAAAEPVEGAEALDAEWSDLDALIDEAKIEKEPLGRPSGGRERGSSASEPRSRVAADGSDAGILDPG